MKMRTLKTALYLSVAAMAFAANANAASDYNPQLGWYTGISGDATWTQHSNTGGGVNVDAGYRIAPDFRLEGELGYHNTPGDSGYSNTHYISYMGNAYFDFNEVAVNTGYGSHIVPYVGGGIGAATYTEGHSSISNTYHNGDTNFAYQVMAGLQLTSDSMPNVDWTLGYRYTGVDDDNIQANNIELGARLHF